MSGPRPTWKFQMLAFASRFMLSPAENASPQKARCAHSNSTSPAAPAILALLGVFVAHEPACVPPKCK